jgi:hypothetical protein
MHFMESSTQFYIYDQMDIDALPSQVKPTWGFNKVKLWKIETW